jgi:hypothetical protein
VGHRRHGGHLAFAGDLVVVALRRERIRRDAAERPAVALRRRDERQIRSLIEGDRAGERALRGIEVVRDDEIRESAAERDLAIGERGRSSGVGGRDAVIRVRAARKRARGEALLKSASSRPPE